MFSQFCAFLLFFSKDIKIACVNCVWFDFFKHIYVYIAHLVVGVLGFTLLISSSSHLLVNSRSADVRIYQKYSKERTVVNQ